MMRTMPPGKRNGTPMSTIASVASVVALWALCTAVPSAQLPVPIVDASAARQWLGQEQQIEEHLKNASITRIEDIGTGVTRPRRAFLSPNAPVESLVWKVLPPGRRQGYWESYKSEIAAYELDRLLNMRMVPPPSSARSATKRAPP